MAVAPKEKNHRILIMAGGTGGHVFPAIEVAKKLQHKQCDINWLGTHRGIEQKLVGQLGYPLYFTQFSGVRGKGLRRLFVTPFSLSLATWKMYRLLSTLQPSAIIGFGGYTSVPGAIAAKIKGIPLLIHEQNSVAGSANRYLAKLAKVVFSAYPTAFKPGPKVTIIGNPVRPEIKPKASQSIKNNPLNLLVLGGSLGAQFINKTIPEAMALIPEQHRPVIKHQCGINHFDMTKTDYQSHQVKVEILPFVDDINGAYQWADLVICRGGAMTLAEINQANLPAIIIPLPNAIDNHQKINSEYLAQKNAAILMEQAQCSSAQLAEQVLNLINDRQRLIELHNCLKAMPQYNSAESIAEKCMFYCWGKQHA